MRLPHHDAVPQISFQVDMRKRNNDLQELCKNPYSRTCWGWKLRPGQSNLAHQISAVLAWEGGAEMGWISWGAWPRLVGTICL